MFWVALVGMLGIGVGVALEGVKGLQGKPDDKGRKTSKGTAYAALVIGVLIMLGAVVLPFVA